MPSDYKSKGTESASLLVHKFEPYIETGSRGQNQKEIHHHLPLKLKKGKYLYVLQEPTRHTVRFLFQFLDFVIILTYIIIACLCCFHAYNT